MKKSLSIIAVVLLCALTAAAQDTPRVETFLGYTYQRANSASNVPAFSMNGGSGQVAVNFSKYCRGKQPVVYSGGGRYPHPPATLSIPEDGRWYVVADLGGNSARGAATVEVQHGGGDRGASQEEPLALA